MLTGDWRKTASMDDSRGLKFEEIATSPSDYTQKTLASWYLNAKDFTSD
jgi:hypothetical protein